MLVAFSAVAYLRILGPKTPHKQALRWTGWFFLFGLCVIAFNLFR